MTRGARSSILVAYGALAVLFATAALAQAPQAGLSASRVRLADPAYPCRDCSVRAYVIDPVETGAHSQPGRNADGMELCLVNPIGFRVLVGAREAYGVLTSVDAESGGSLKPVRVFMPIKAAARPGSGLVEQTLCLPSGTLELDAGRHRLVRLRRATDDSSATRLGFKPDSAAMISYSIDSDLPGAVVELPFAGSERPTRTEFSVVSGFEPAIRIRLGGARLALNQCKPAQGLYRDVKYYVCAFRKN